MTIKASASVLIPIFAAAARAVPRNAQMPILESVRVDASPEKGVTVTGFNLENAVVASSRAVEVTKPGTACIAAAPLVAILKAQPAAQLVTITLDDAGESVRVKGRSSHRLPALPADDYPAPPYAGNAAAPLPSGFLGALSRTAAFVSKDSLRPAMQGVFVHANKGLLASTDGHRLASVPLGEDGEASPFASSVILSEAFCSLALALLTKETDVAATVAAGHVAFQSHTVGEAMSVAVIGRLIDETYPNYEAVIPPVGDSDTVLVAPREDFIAAVRRVSLSASDVNRQAVLNVGVEGVQIRADAAERGTEGEDRVDGIVTGSPLRIGFKADYLLSVLEAARGENVTLRFTSPNRAVRVEDEGGVTLLVMPVKLNTYA